MVLFIKAKPVNILPALEKEDAMEIYELLKTKDANTLFLEGIATDYSEQVIAEMRRLENEMNSKMNGSFELTSKIPAVYNEEGDISKKEILATYYTVTTETALKSSMSSTLLDVDIVAIDVRIWSDGNPNETPNWTTYKASFN